MSNNLHQSPQEYLQLLLKISESVTRLESLLLISGPNENGLDSLTSGATNGEIAPTSHADIEAPADRYVHPLRTPHTYSVI
jgi:hypothetical protein